MTKSMYDFSEGISVFGGQGFVGKHYVTKSKYKTFVVPRDSSESRTNTALFLIGTVDNYNVFSNPHLDIDSNLTKLIEVLQINRSKFPNFRLIYVSTWFVYGKTSIPFNEDQQCNPKGFYSITKYCAEMLLESYCRTFGIAFTIVRLGNVLGPDDLKTSKRKNAIQFMLKQLRNNEEVTLYENGDILRDLIHVDDVVRGLDMVIDKGNNGEIYNLASGCGVSVGSLINGYKEKIRSESKIKTIESPDFHKIVQVKDSLLDITKVSNLGFDIQKPITLEMLDEL